MPLDETHSELKGMCVRKCTVVAFVWDVHMCMCVIHAHKYIPANGRDIDNMSVFSASVCRLIGVCASVLVCACINMLMVLIGDSPASVTGSLKDACSAGPQSSHPLQLVVLAQHTVHSHSDSAPKCEIL